MTIDEELQQIEDRKAALAERLHDVREKAAERAHRANLYAEHGRLAERLILDALTPDESARLVAVREELDRIQMGESA